MTVRASITIDGVAALKPSQIRAAARVALRAVGETWINRFLPLHFQNIAFARYGYTPRQPYYRMRKRKRVEIGGVRAIGEDKPLVFSGRSRERAKAARVDAKAPSSTRAYADIIIDAPALNFKPTGSTVNMRDEVTRVTQEEQDILSNVFVRAFEAELDRLGRTTKRRRAA
jgi:hypothetical protein